MGYAKGSTRWYLKAAKSIQAPSASAATLASAFTLISTAAQSSSTQELGLSSEAPSWFLSFQQDFSSFSFEVRTGLQNIKAKVTSLDKRVTLIEQYHTKTSKSSDPMEISSAYQSTNDDDGDDDGNDDDDANDDDARNSENEGDEENTDEEGTQEEGGEEADKGDDSVEED
ncbi:uncharacterized protein LOC131160914 [Malania oleifera]|uniref:uncharacterized protein LOC131160914 n=1 Tax=Malania oleifera TaxID=397392 RepID=UPI0025AE825F|nr:uncharacterized protein LOC131160914 [Malania oleifera]